MIYLLLRLRGGVLRFWRKTIFLLHRFLIAVFILLTLFQLFIHFYEYFLLFWPSHRSSKYKNKIRLFEIVRWESAYYSIIAIWLIGLECFHFKIFPLFWIILFFLFTLLHVIGFVQLALRESRFISVSTEAKRNSSVIELIIIFQRIIKQNSSWLIAIFIVIFDLIEITILFELFFQLVKLMNQK